MAAPTNANRVSAGEVDSGCSHDTYTYVPDVVPTEVQVLEFMTIAAKDCNQGHKARPRREL